MLYKSETENTGIMCKPGKSKKIKKYVKNTTKKIL